MTALTSLGSSAFLTPAIFALQNASNDLANSTARLSSGNRIINVGDDVAGFSIAAGLQSQLSGLNQANSNVAQGISLLQVAEGGLQQINDIITNLQSLASQATSGGLTNSQRGFLQQQFTQYVTTINSIAGSTSFNGLNLIDGTLAGASQLQAQTTGGTRAAATLTFGVNPAGGQTVIINNVTLTANVDFAVGGSATTTIANLATALSASTNPALSQATYSASNGALTITARTGGTQGNQFVIDQANSTAAFVTTGGSTDVVNKFTLTGGADNGIHVNSTQATGTIGNNVINTQAQTPANVALTVSGAVNNNETLQIDNGHGGLITFTFKTTAAAATDIQIGATTEQTLQNAITTITNYSTADSAGDNYGLRQLSFSTNGNQLVITNRTVGNATEMDGATALNISETLANGALSSASFNNGVNTGVNTSGITNSSFTGTIQGITATYIAPDSVTASVSVGGVAYTGAITDTTPGANTSVRFASSGGDFFDVQLASGNGSTVNNQSDANNYAGRLNAAFAGLTFTQDRPLTGINASGVLAGATASLKLSSFSSSNTTLSDITVTAPSSPGNDGTIDFTIGGATFEAKTGLGGSIGAHETVTFTNTQNPSQTMTLVNGSSPQDLSTTVAASQLQSALRSAFDIGVSGSGINLQVGPASSDTLNVSIGSATSSTLFSGASLDISTTGGAAAAQTVITAASNIVIGLLSTVGSSQSSLSATSGNLQQSITGITAAHSALSDTDIVAESTTFAQDTVRVNAAVAVIAQAMALKPSLLALLHSAGRA